MCGMYDIVIVFPLRQADWEKLARQWTCGFVVGQPTLRARLCGGDNAGFHWRGPQPFLTFSCCRHDGDGPKYI
jgi:hypothetical protein